MADLGKRDVRISIHALLAESDGYRQAVTHCKEISIHALLAESDGSTVGGAREEFAISIHALLAESDQGIHAIA